MHIDSNQILAITDIFSSEEAPDHIDLNGRRIAVKKFAAFQSKETDYSSSHILLDERIFCIVSRGNPSPYDIRRATEQVKRSLSANEYGQLDLVWDLREIERPGIRIRKAVIEAERKLRRLLKVKFVVASSRYKTLLKVYKILHRRELDELDFAPTLDAAIERIYSQDGEEGEHEVVYRGSMPKREALEKMSKDQLIDMIQEYNYKYHESTQQVLEALGQISIGNTFRKFDLSIDEDEPHFELVNAFSLLQQDVQEIIKEYKDLNQNLELKVAERIVDFIDKESNLRSILDNSDRVTWLINNNYELIDFNLAFSNEIKRRYRTTPTINRNVLDLIHDERQKEEWKSRFDSALTGKPGIYLDQDDLGDQERVWEIKTFPIKEVGKIKGVSIFVEDITQLKQNQLKLIEKNKDLQKVNSELDSFVYRVSHDLRAPLTSILGLISLMKLETNQDKISEYVGLQEKSIQKLDLFIKEIINLSRNSRLGIAVSEIGFPELLEEVFEGQHYNSSAIRVERISKIESNTPFYTDRHRLSILLNNLISNSLKYVNPNQKKPFVQVKINSNEKECQIEVSDNGIGISEQFLPKIFEMFFRATEEFSGSGLGLYIVKETVDKLKGKISVKSKTREGSTFKVILPNLIDRFEAAPKLND